MGFDLASAKTVTSEEPAQQTGGFDLGSAKPVYSSSDASSPDGAIATLNRLQNMQEPSLSERLLMGLDNPGSAFEAARHYITGALGSVGGGLAGILSGGNADAVNNIQRAATYQPTDPLARDLVATANKPLSIFPNAGDRAGGAVADATGSPFAGATANTLIQAIPMLLSGGESVLSGRGIKPAEAVAGADVVKRTTLAAAQPEGLVVPPSLTKNPPAYANTMNGLGGIAETNKLARDINTPLLNNLVAKDIGLAPDTPLTPTAIGNQISKAVAQGYDPIRNLGEIPIDKAHIDAMQQLAKSDRGASKIDPRLGNAQIADLADALTPKGGANGAVGGSKVPTWDAGNMVDTISALRSKAADAYSAGNPTMGKAFKQGANSLESLIDRHLQKQGDSSVLTDYRMARTQIAKAMDAKDALNPATGDIDPRILASLDEGQMTGGSKVAADFARAFPDVAVPSKGTPPGVTAFQANVEPSAGILGSLANLAGRPLARKYALSPDVQKQLASLQPKRATLSREALNAVFANPTAFSAMYEDQGR